MTGGRVPLTKTSESWQTELYELLNPMGAVRDRDCGEGLEYSDYLQGLLILEGSSTKTQRTMDIMEMDVREITGNRDFRFDLCLDEFRMRAAAQACGRTFEYNGTNGYN